MNNSIAPPSAAGQNRFYYGYVIVIVSFIILFVLGGTFFIFGVFLKPLATEFHWSRAVTSGAYSLGLFILGLMFMVTGRLTDRFGPRLVVTAFTFILGMAYLLASRTQTAWQLYLFYGMIAVGQSGGLVPLMSTTARWFVKRRGLMTGVVIAGVGLGTTVMAPVASYLIATYGWRKSYIILGLLVWLGTIIPAQFLKRDPSKTGQFPDGESGPKQNTLLAGASGYSRSEAVRTPQFWITCLAYFALGAFVYMLMVHLVPFATDLGVPAITASGILAVSSALGTVGRVAAGFVGDRAGNKKALIIVFCLVLAALLWIQVSRELWTLYLLAAIFGLAYGSSVSLESPLTAEFFGMKAHGAILGIVHFSYVFGGAISPLVTGQIYDVRGAYQLAFWLMLGLSVIAFGFTLFLRPNPKTGA